MPIKREPQVLSWSYSRLRDYLRCAALARFKHVDKLKEPGSAPMDEGSYVDHLAEVWSTKNVDKPLPDEPWATQFAQRYAKDQKRMRRGQAPTELARFPAEFEALRAISGRLHPQEQLALDASWRDLGPKGWFDTSGRTRVRIKMDVWWDEAPRRFVVDFKNGKVRVEDQEQLELYVIGAFATAPAVITEVEPLLWYLAEGVVLPEQPRVYTRADLPELQKRWARKAAPLLADRTFAPNPGRQCSWCFFSQAKGGPCQH